MPKLFATLATPTTIKNDGSANGHLHDYGFTIASKKFKEVKIYGKHV